MVHSTWFLKLHRDIMGRGHISLGKCLNMLREFKHTVREKRKQEESLSSCTQMLLPLLFLKH